MASEFITEYLSSVADMLDEANEGRFEEWAYKSHQRMVLDLGQPFERKALPREFRRMKEKECYGNAFYCVTKFPHDRYQYVEGWASGMFPTEHAWVLDTEDGKIFDPTWPRDDRHFEYYGIVFPTNFVIQHTIKTGYYGLIVNDWMNDNELARLGRSLWEDADGCKSA